MEKRRIVVIHGFLGLPSDWNRLEWGKDVQVEAIDLWQWIKTNASSFQCSSEDNAFDFFAQSFLKTLEIVEDPVKPLLVGYSLGGRLAMHILLMAPSRFVEAVFISAHPGLAEWDEQLRKQRRDNDANWANKFCSSQWHEIVDEWNSQEVLASSVASERHLRRDEADFDRLTLSWALKNWSLGLQRDLRKELQSVSVPIHWICGERDQKFTKVLSEIDKPATQRLSIVSGAGHRVPWDNPQAMADLIKFMKF